MVKRRKKDRLLTDALREVRNTFSRFLSILVLSALAVAFLAGLRATAPDMEYTADNYFDRTCFMDGYVLATLGLTQEDLEALEEQGDIADVEGIWNLDAIAADAIVTVRSMPEKLNFLNITEGRLPAAPDECVTESLLLAQLGLELGDRVELKLEEDNEGDLAVLEYTIVGVAESPLYVNTDRGSSSLGGGSIDAFLYVPRENFQMDYYTAAYFTFHGLKEMDSYSDAYDEKLDDLIDSLDYLADVRAQARTDSVKGDAQKEIDDAQKELDDAREEAEQELADAWQELLDARKELDDGWVEYQDGVDTYHTEIADAEQELADALKELQDAEKELADGKKEYQDGLKDYEDGKVKYEDGLQEYLDGEKEYADALETWRDGKAQYDDGLAQYQDGEKEYQDGLAELQDAEAQYEDGLAEFQQGEQDYQDGLAQLEDAEAQYADGLVQYEDGEKEYAENKAKLEDAEAQYADGLAQYESGWADYQAGLSEYQAGYNQYESGRQLLESKEKEYEDGLALALGGPGTLEDFQKQLEDAEKDLQGYEILYQGLSPNYDLYCSVVEEFQGDRTFEQAVAETEMAIGVYKVGNDTLVQLLKVPGMNAETAAQAVQGQLTETQAKLQAPQSQEEILQLKVQEQGFLLVLGGLGAGIEPQTLQTQLAGSMEKLSKSEATAVQAYTYKTQVEELEKGLNDGKAQLEQGKAALAQLTEGRQQLDAGWAELNSSKPALDAAAAQINAGRRQLEESKQILDDSRKELDDGWAQLEEGRKTLDDSKKTLEDSRREMDEGWEELNEGKATLEENRVKLEDAKRELDDGWEELREAAITLQGSWAELEDARVELEDGWAELMDARKTLDDSRVTLEDARVELEDGAAELEDARKEIEDGQQKLDDGWAEYNDGVAELEDAKVDGQKELDDALAELEDGEAEYADGMAEYEDGKAEADEEIADAQGKLDDARQELADVADCEWYVLGRDTNSGFVGYSQDAERVGNLASIFPVIFFLVAALACLTTMTRMVEEQRSQIGALKALGFSRFAIAKKYIGYALFASLFGGLLGLSIGCTLFPFVIANAFNIMYDIPTLEFKSQVPMFVLAVLAAVVCTTGAGLWACLSTLVDTPANLMRPKAPKPGKRVLLERITPIWSRLNFTWKVTMRNLFRYKRRFWMTVAGIGGCTALIVTGFGLHDSIFSILDRQFDEISLYDATVGLDPDATPEELLQVETYLDGNPAIARWMHSSQSGVEASDGGLAHSATLFAVDDLQKFTQFIDLRHRTDDDPVVLPEHGIIITEKLSELLEAEVGDTLTIKKDDVRVEAVVGDIVENYVYHYVYLSSDFYQELFGESPELNVSMIQYQEASEEQSNQVSVELMAMDAVTAYSYIATIRDTFTSSMEAIDYAVVIIIVAAAALAFVVLYNLTNINITERTRELATLKVLGFYDTETTAYVYRENIFLTLFGILMGLVMGRFLHSWMVLTVEVDLVMFGRTAPAYAYVLAAALTVVFSVVVNIAAHFKLKKVDMVESLKSVE